MLNTTPLAAGAHVAAENCRADPIAGLPGSKQEPSPLATREQARTVPACYLAGGSPGSVRRLAPGDAVSPPESWRDSHGLSLPAVIGLARSITGLPEDVIVFGVEPEDLSFGVGLSPVVRESLPVVVEEVAREIEKWVNV